MDREQTAIAQRLYGKEVTPPAFIRALTQVKLACFKGALEGGFTLEKDKEEAIISVMEEILQGHYLEEFCLPLQQGGAGTSLHMNYLETIADLVNSQRGLKVDPIEDLNPYQSTNDVIPTAFIILLREGLERVEREIILLQESLVHWEQQTTGILIWGRTELQKALPIQLSQVFGSWAGFIERDRWRFAKLKERIRTIPLGGTALGTSFYAPRSYLFAAEKHLRRLTGLPLSRSQNLPDAIAHSDSIAETAQGFALAGGNLYKIASDLSLYTMDELGVFRHPSLNYGSSIMGVKENPVLLEYVRGLALRGQKEASLMGEYSRNSQLQLNPFIPFMIETYIHLEETLLKALVSLNQELLPALTLAKEDWEGDLYSHRAILNLLRPVIPYEDIKALNQAFPQGEIKGKEDFLSFIQDKLPRPEGFWESYFETGHITGVLQEKYL